MRWYDEGAMSSAMAAALDMQRARVDVPLELASAASKRRLERQHQQEREQHLGARQRHPDLVEQLDELPVEALLGRLVGVALLARWPASGRGRRAAPSSQASAQRLGASQRSASSRSPALARGVVLQLVAVDPPEAEVARLRVPEVEAR